VSAGMVALYQNACGSSFNQCNLTRCVMGGENEGVDSCFGAGGLGNL
jgi:hypothetical protein